MWFSQVKRAIQKRSITPQGAARTFLVFAHLCLYIFSLSGCFQWLLLGNPPQTCLPPFVFVVCFCVFLPLWCAWTCGRSGKKWFVAGTDFSFYGYPQEMCDYFVVNIRWCKRLQVVVLGVVINSQKHIKTQCVYVYIWQKTQKNVSEQRSRQGH